MTATESAPPKGWITAGSHPDSYEMGSFTDFCHSGTKCARLCSKTDAIDGFGTLMQSVKADSYRGKRIELTAFVKSESVDGCAGLWMRVDVGQEYVSFDNMHDRPIKGDTDWTQYHVVLDVPEKSTNISFGVLLSGAGSVWMDDFELNVVGLDVPSTDTTWSSRSCGIQYQNLRPINLDFSQGLRDDSKEYPIDATPVGWFKQKYGDGDVEIGLSKPSGNGNAVSAFVKVDAAVWGSLLQAVHADAYVGKRVMLSGSVKTEALAGNATLFFRADAGRELTVCHDYMEGRELTGTNDWTECKCVIDIPEGSDNIYIGGVVNGDGTAWFKDFALTEVSADTATTGKHGKLKKNSESRTTANKTGLTAEPLNLDFEDGEYGSKSGAHRLPIGWMASGSNPDIYKMCVDDATKFAGGKCALIASRREGQRGFGTLMQMVHADFCLGKKMRLSAQIKSEDVSWAALWMRIDGEDSEVLGFDNMQKNPIKGTTDWNYYECVLDVPPGAKAVAFGVLLSGEGKVWFSKVALETASDDVEVTDTKEDIQERLQPVNMCFEESEC
ncbi:MAG: hypothetical protein WC714_11425 [Candidatus Obscuribacterales bacterium]|jgi:hypothetical protein